jgi:TetR/AcrR family tetracycline transcriptional repressor
MTLESDAEQPADPARGGAPRRGRPRLTDAPGPTRQAVIAAVVRLAQDQKDADINMRDLARALGVSPKLLYRHVSGKDELLDLAAGAILETWEAPTPGLPWPERLTEVMRSTRALVRRFPALSQTILLRNLEARDSPEVTKVVATIKSCFEDAGLSNTEANQVFFVYEALILGELALSKAVREGAISSANIPSQSVLDAGFETGLRYMIAGITASRAGRTGQTTGAA